MVRAEFHWIPELRELTAGQPDFVETKIRHYQIECLCRNRIRIGPVYCREPLAAHLEGAFDKENGLEWGLMGSESECFLA